MVDNDKQQDIRIEDLYPGHTPEWYAEAEDSLRRYLAVMVRIHERLKAEGKDWPPPEETGRITQDELTNE
jgi:hypothetical protein